MDPVEVTLWFHVCQQINTVGNIWFWPVAMRKQAILKYHRNNGWHEAHPSYSCYEKKKKKTERELKEKFTRTWWKKFVCLLFWQIGKKERKSHDLAVLEEKKVSISKVLTFKNLIASFRQSRNWKITAHKYIILQTNPADRAIKGMFWHEMNFSHKARDRAFQFVFVVNVKI